ncbi:OPT oligopeptide transporter protein [Glomus cerebriforme]|uniref:OPT oligopeptide transporter protein n=1 Tax=Glomus cerebriforme TaxID=658196 RepID=A0A397T7L2_9GLOM|nr:OPT oligopeptide transporter protein [Glomus cerebriforme]
MGDPEKRGKNEKNDPIFVEEEGEGEENLMIAAAVSTEDDPTLPCLTFRFWVLSTFFTILCAAISQFYHFRPNSGYFSPFFVLFVSYVVGNWMARVLPTRTFRILRWNFSLNPGPFNIKEHVCIYVATGAGGGSAYATDIIAIQELFYHHTVTFFKGILLLMSTQILGYGLAGFLRKFLVRPANMIWPANLVLASTYNTLHGNLSETQDKLRLFAIAFSILFVWQFVPQYMFTWLTSIALLCLIAPYSKTMKRLGSGYHGVGLLNFTLDWNSIAQPGPFYTPWWAQVNYYFGIIVGVWIIAPLLYYNNVLDAQRFPFLSTYPLDKNGQRYNQTAIIDRITGNLNVTAYENYSPVYLSVTFAVNYLYSFISITAVISHVFLFYGKEIWERFRSSREDEKEDIHCRMMSVYQEIPNSWYFLIFIIMLLIAIVLGYTTEANLPWWGLLMAVGLSAIMVLPIGIIQAISNNQIGLNVITEMICGYILLGRPIANVYFKCYGFVTLYQCLLLVSDLKLGHYMKIPPRSMFVSQLYGTVIGGFINYWVLQLIIASKRPYLDGTMDDPTGQVTGYHTQVFNTASIVWGLIGPTRTFGPGSLYNPLLWGFLIGFLIPVPFYLLHRKFPKFRFDLVNVPLICNGLQLIPESYTNFIIMGFIASFLSQFYAYRYENRLWKKYNYVLSAAFDSAAQMVTLVIFFCLNGVIQVSFPEWWGNNRESQGERCFADVQ